MLDRELFEAMQVVTGDDQCKGIFNILTEEGAASGWAVAKRLGREPEKIEQGLTKLRESGIVEGTGSGLGGFYSLTGLGFKLRSQLVGS
jgi:predicted transcriptional regulator